MSSNEPVKNECEVIYEMFHEMIGPLTFSGFYIHNCINCVHNCEDHSLLETRRCNYTLISCLESFKAYRLNVVESKQIKIFTFNDP